MAGSVQFVGKDQVMTAFESRDIEAWGIFQGKQFIHKGIGGEDLSGFLDMLLQGGTNATYTLKVYEGMKDASGIKEKTECDGSYNFKINVPGEGIAGAGYMANQGNAELLKRLKAIEEKFEQEETVIDSEPETIGSVANAAVVEIIKDPNKALQWMTILKNIFSQSPMPVDPNFRALPTAAAVGNINIAGQATPEEKLDRLAAAIDTLEKTDPNLVEHLEKLATIATSKPAAFKNLLSMLELL